MILKASQRGGAKQLGLHLLRMDDNDHVEIHEIRGFISDNLISALKEAQAVSQGTKCKQFLFSVSFSPPPLENVPIDVFEKAIEEVEAKNNLAGQPRVILFHEKDGRRHAHAVWSRIDVETMTARNHSHFKLKLRDISRQIFFEQEWRLPEGLMNSEKRDPRNFSLAEWQAAKRYGVHAGDQKEMFQECWAVSDSKSAFQNALAERGYILAQGDRRRHVAVSHEGQVVAITRMIGQRTKEVAAKLGSPESLPTVEEAKEQLQSQFRTTFGKLARELAEERRASLDKLEKQRRIMIAQHRSERDRLDKAFDQRWKEEATERASRFQNGWKGFWQHLTGQHQKIQQKNQTEAYGAILRDRKHRQLIISAQLSESSKLAAKVRRFRKQTLASIKDLKTDRDQLVEKLNKPAREPTSPVKLKRQRRSRRRSNNPDYGL